MAHGFGKRTGTGSQTTHKSDEIGLVGIYPKQSEQVFRVSQDSVQLARVAIG
jgi:hypothetical protein